MPASLRGKCSTEPFFVIRGVQEAVSSGQISTEVTKRERKRRKLQAASERGIRDPPGCALSGPHSPISVLCVLED